METALIQKIFENLPLNAFLLNPDYEIVWANQMCLETTGLTREQIVGRHCFKNWRMGEPCLACPLKRVIETNKPVKHLLPQPGQRVWPLGRGKWDLHLFPVMDDGGTVSVVLEVAHEVTPSQEMREALSKSKARLKEAQTLAHLGHWELNHQTNELYWSDEIFNIFELDPREFGASYEAFLGAIHPDDRETIHAAFTDSVQKKLPYKIEHRLLMPDGRIKYVQERSKNYYDENGNQVRSLGTVQDISERKSFEAEHEKLQRQLVQAQKMESVGRLAGGVAHDYNNISNIIIGYADIMLGRISSGDPLHEYVTEIRTAAKRATDITRQLLAFARRQIIAPKLLDLNATLADMAKMLRRLVGEDIEIGFLPGESIWQVKIDPSQIDQIMANLCVNARDAIVDVGKITIETQNTSFDESYCRLHVGFIPGEYVLLSVSDNGAGIAPDVVEKVFEPFFTTKELGKGTGLGLATVYGIVRQNNGFINLYSEPGTGTVIKIYLPRHSGPIAAVAHKESDRLPASKGETILLVEDDASILKLANILLTMLGYVVLPAGGPEQAIKMAKEHEGPIDLLVTDVVMPKMNGRILSEHLKKPYPKIKTLFVSGYTANVIADRGVLQEGMSFLSKPFSKKELAFKIRQVLD